jgi:hypothetical protein
LRHTTAQGVQCGGEGGNQLPGRRGSPANTAWTRDGVVTGTRDRAPLFHFWPLDRSRTVQIEGAEDSIVSVRQVRPGGSWMPQRHGGWRRPEVQPSRSAAPLVSGAWWSTPAGSSAEDAGNVAAASFEDRESPRALCWGRRLVPRGRRRHGLPNAPSSIATQDRN